MVKVKIRQCELVSVPWRGSNFFMVQCLNEMPRIFPSPDGALIVSKAAYMFISTFGFPSPDGALIVSGEPSSVELTSGYFRPLTGR